MSGYYSDEPIVDVEKRTKEIGAILGDPTLFPVEFLNWLKRYIEQSGIQLPLSSIIGGFKASGGSVQNMAPGIILGCGMPDAPPGSVPCEGQTLSQTTEALLFGRIGHRWGTPADPATSFLAPDFRHATPAGYDPANPAFNTIGMYGGEERHTLSSLEHGHQHGTLQVQAGTGAFPAAPNFPGGGGSNEAGSHNNMPPYGVVLFVITTGH